MFSLPVSAGSSPFRVVIVVLLSSRETNADSGTSHPIMSRSRFRNRKLRSSQGGRLAHRESLGDRRQLLLPLQLGGELFEELQTFAQMFLPFGGEQADLLRDTGGYLPFHPLADLVALFGQHELDSPAVGRMRFAPDETA